MAVGLARPLAVGLANAVYLGGKIPRQGQGQTGSLKFYIYHFYMKKVFNIGTAHCSCK
jgi:hypothetical protein